jgi:hypothetical protein
MASLRDDEVRRLLKHLRRRVDDEERLAEIEQELRSEFGQEFLREPDLLTYFPELSGEFIAASTRWKLRVIPHAHLRMVQRGIGQGEVSAVFRRFVETYTVTGQVVVEGHYSIIGRPKPRATAVTVRADVNYVANESGQAHVVTVYVGRGDSEGMIEVGPV